eukprot:GHRQ01023308.1.p2 GENE.GHRQ01023308.1~~GHRQ01023308.1.p2  ORF type:complete len:171 (+),score=46.52 GHRQ01023308.1:590-1102(+)
MCLCWWFTECCPHLLHHACMWRAATVNVLLSTCCPACPMTVTTLTQRAHWQAHTAGVSSVDYVPARPFANSMCGANGSGMVQPLIVGAGRDSNVAVWTLDGGFVGLCGDHSWDLDRQETWRDAAGLQQRPPQPAEEGMFIKVGCEAGGADSAAAAGWRHCQQLPTMSLLP